MKKIIEKIFNIKNHINMESKKWFLVSYLVMLIIFFTAIHNLIGFIHSLMIAPILALAGLVIAVIGIIMYIIYVGLGFFLGKILKKYSLYLAKGFTYGSITIIILTLLFSYNL